MTDSVKGRTDRTVIDQVYHQMRIANIELPSESKMMLRRLVSHLLSEDGDYQALLDFLAFYGAKYVLKDVFKIIEDKGLEFNRVIELGAGHGWLSEGIGKCFNKEYIKTDSRKWACIRQVIDLESVRGLWELSRNLVPTDLVVMSDVIHCLDIDKRVSLMNALRHNDIIILEYMPANKAQMASYVKQIRAKNCVPVNHEDMMILGARRIVTYYPTSSHGIYIYRKEI